MKGEEKMKKKVINKRKFRSAPNLKIDETKIKRTDTILVSPEDIRTYKREMNAKNAEQQQSKQKQVKKNKSKKLNTKDVDKILMQPIKSKEMQKTVPPNYQFMIKKNIINLLGAAKKGQKMQASKKTQTKPLAKKPGVKKTKSEGTKMNLQQNLLQLAAEGRKETKGKVLKRAKPIPAALPRHSEPLTRQNLNSALIAQQRSVPAANIHSNKKIQRLKNLFNAFQSIEKSSKAHNLSSLFAGEEEKPVDKKITPVKKRSVKKNNKIPQKIKPRPADDLGEHAGLKMKPKNSASPHEIIANLTKTLPPLDAPTAANKPEKKRPKKTSPEKLLYAVST